jgi:hypothetical protein
MSGAREIPHVERRKRRMEKEEKDREGREVGLPVERFSFSFFPLTGGAALFFFQRGVREGELEGEKESRERMADDGWQRRHKENERW